MATDIHDKATRDAFQDIAFNGEVMFNVQPDERPLETHVPKSVARYLWSGNPIAIVVDKKRKCVWITESAFQRLSKAIPQFAIKRMTTQ